MSETGEQSPDGQPLTAWPTGRLLSVAARRVERAWDAFLEPWALSHASVPVLAVLAREPRSQRELAAVMGVTEQTISRMVAGLQRSGYLSRERHAADRRRHVVALTADGRAALAAIDGAGSVEALIAGLLDEDQVAQLRTLLRDLMANLPPSPFVDEAPRRAGPSA